ncbi:hypothetical protein BRAO375_670010 [Bradyrhizobium sp. ORS 375]|uniref:TIGR02391 family protein n=1 Tax=Bradyrhizobium sp. (strain ORS 375) TaxID=566679 RepID=UPI00024059D9|nr:TIGR02391 family protein [Bradyrhizobium sp. ORS 375]CCD96608.1 hypothetical protein BRAO375_670010 [Bradyrhizobium sp. ORS 375]
MISQFLERIKQLQEHILEVGLAQTVLALPAPRMLALPRLSEDSGPVGIYIRAVTEFEIESVSRDLYASGHYSLAVQEAFKAVEKYVQQKSCALGVSGTQLMQQVFSTANPMLFWSERKTTSEQDEQKGYLQLYAGAMLGIRNPVTHEFKWIDDPLLSLELILFAQHLLRKAKMARTSNESEGLDRSTVAAT